MLNRIDLSLTPCNGHISCGKKATRNEFKPKETGIKDMTTLHTDVLESTSDNAIRFLHQAKAIAVLLSDEEAFDRLPSSTVANAFWLLLDRLHDLEGALMTLNSESLPV